MLKWPNRTTTIGNKQSNLDVGRCHIILNYSLSALSYPVHLKTTHYFAFINSPYTEHTPCCSMRTQNLRQKVSRDLPSGGKICAAVAYW